MVKERTCDWEEICLMAPPYYGADVNDINIYFPVFVVYREIYRESTVY